LVGVQFAGIDSAYSRLKARLRNLREHIVAIDWVRLRITIVADALVVPAGQNQVRWQ